MKVLKFFLQVKTLFVKALLIIIITSMYKCSNSDKDKSQIIKKTADEEKIEKEISLMKKIENNPDSLLPKENLIQFYRTNNKYEKALGALENYLLKDTFNIRLLHIKSLLLLEKADTLAAIANLEKTISIYPSALDIIILGAVYANQGNENSIAIANILLRDFRDKAEAEAYYIKGTYLSNTGNKKSAIEAFDLCINHTITFMEAYREKALALAELKKNPEAISTLNKALTLNNNYPEGYFFLGKILEKSNDINGAVSAYQKALMYDSSYTEAADAIKRLNK
jgi:tetratricopeptide (TPR) repeat protein